MCVYEKERVTEKKRERKRGRECREEPWLKMFILIWIFYINWNEASEIKGIHRETNQ